jgi:altronate dehydratase large subunit
MITGFRRQSGKVGARDHILVLPSVVCSSRVAREIAGDSAVAITHQHGCAHVGDDALHTGDVFAGLATNPNVGAVLVVGLGCETIQGEELARRITATGQRTEFLGIQSSGGTDATIASGREIVSGFAKVLGAGSRTNATTGDLLIGLDDATAPFAAALRSFVEAEGAAMIAPEEPGARGPNCHPDLAARGAQVIVSWSGTDDGAHGFGICPVISVSGDSEMYSLMPDDFDFELDRDADGTAAAVEVARSIWERTIETFNGRSTATERRGSGEFLLRRLTRSM